MPTEAEEVAEDYRLALEDLSSNQRFEISNLTVIARENTEHALLIAQTLEQHILKTGPSKKLPALYLLDSIVKNVGTPYTLYLGRNLFKIFMESYTVVDQATRVRMGEMLKTWKQPVAGSMDTRPVFSPELVKPIENALMRARAAMMPQAQLAGRPRPGMPPHRNTPTPPGMTRSASGTPNFTPQPYQYPHGAPPNGQAPYGQLQPHSQHTTPQPAGPPTAYQPPPSAYGTPTPAPQAGVNIETLSNDIQNLVVALRAQAIQSPHDASVQTRLKALLDLQSIVQSTSLPQDQLDQIRNQVTELAAVTLRAQQNHAAPPPQQYVPPAAAQPASSVAPPAQGSVTLDSLLGNGALAALMARQSSQNSTPVPPAASSAVRSPMPAQAAPYAPPPPAQTNQPLSLMEQLRQAGMVPSTTPTNASPVAPPPAATPALPASVLQLLSAQRANSTPAQPTPYGLDSASLKQPVRPDILSSLHQRLGAPCTQCGRRFTTDAAGKEKKTAHMDWHFQSHQRSIEALKRGTHRSWYVDAADWIAYRETIDMDHTHASGAGNGTDSPGKASAAAAQPKYIPVPEPSRGINNVCPICQDKFENKWLDTAQEWVWLDAVLVGGRAFHDSCHKEATRDRRDRTPDVASVLGKRRAEGTLASPKVRSLKTFG